MARTLTRSAGRAVAAATALLAAGCAATPDEPADAPASAADAAAPAPSQIRVSPTHRAYWAPRTAVRAVTIDRQTTFALVEAEANVFIVETDGYAPGAGEPSARMTWVVSTPANRAGQEAAIGPTSSEGRGWVTIYRNNRPPQTHELVGFFVFEQAGSDAAAASAELRPRDGGIITAPFVLHSNWERIERPTPIAPDRLATRSGLPNRPTPGPDDRDRTDPVWPWGELVGDHPKPPPRNAHETAFPPR